METEFEPIEGEVRKIEEKRNRKWIWGRKTSKQGWWACISYFDTPSRIVKCDYFRQSKTKFYPPYRGYIWSWKDKLVSDNAELYSCRHNGENGCRDFTAPSKLKTFHSNIHIHPSYSHLFQINMIFVVLFKITNFLVPLWLVLKSPSDKA